MEKGTRKQTHNISKIATIILPITIIVLAVIIVFPFLKYMAFGAILVISMYPIYKKINNKIKRPNISAIIMIILTLLIIIIPIGYASITIAGEVANISEDVLFSLNFKQIDQYTKKIFQTDLNIDEFLAKEIVAYKSKLFEQIPQIISSMTNVIISLIITLFLMFYLFRDGEKIMDKLYKVVTIEEETKKAFFQKITGMSKAILNGQLVVAIIQGIAGGIGFLIFGVEGALFWGAIMAILSLLPLFGAAIVWLPASLYLMGTGSPIRGIGLLLYGGIFVSQIDNVIRPYFVGKKGKIHPFLVFVGVLGGISVFGFLGVLLGPLVLGIAWAMGEFYIEYTKPQNTQEKK